MDGVEGSFGDAQVALVGGLLLFVGLGLIPLGRLLGERLFPAPRVLFVRWGFTHIIAVTLMWLVSSVLAVNMIGSDSVMRSLSAGVLAFAITGAAVYAVARKTEPAPSSSLGLSDASNSRDMTLGLGLYLLFLPAIFGAGLVSPWLVERLGGVAEGQEVLLGIGSLEGDELVFAVMIAAIVMPFFEELLFRGFVQPLLVQNFRETGGVVLTAAFFAYIHPGWVPFLPIFCLSLVLGALYLRTRSLRAVVLVHGLHNALVLSLFLSSEEWRELSGASGLLGG
ncbi:MAG: CPBP family intramembrane metalloprotease [Planctomycetes bacterium]|nr:CPBP family intramembrane metalloprotease [Planctomycetota bacterium]